MTNREWIELFFSESFEKQINNLILEDWDYEIPHDSILNYVHHLLSIPYSSFLNYISNPFRRDEILPQDVPELTTFSEFTFDLINYIKSENDRGVKPEEVGEELNTTYSRNFHGNRKYGRRCLRTAKSIGLVYEFFGQWYLNCLTYVFDDLTQTKILDLISRMCLRSSLYRPIIADWWRNRKVSVKDTLKEFSPEFINRHLNSILVVLYNCKDTAKREDIELGVIVENTGRFNLYAIRQLWSYLRVAFPMHIMKRSAIDNYVYHQWSSTFSPEQFNDLVISCAATSIALDLEYLSARRIESEEDAMQDISRICKDKLMVIDEFGDGQFVHYSGHENKYEYVSDKDLFYIEDEVDEKIQKKKRKKDHKIEWCKELASRIEALRREDQAPSHPQ